MHQYNSVTTITIVSQAPLEHRVDALCRAGRRERVGVRARSARTLASGGVKTRASRRQGGDSKRFGRGRRGELPRQRIGDPVDRMLGDLSEHHSQ